MKKLKRSITSIHKEINKDKYGIKRTISPRDLSKEYEMLPTGWRKKSYSQPKTALEGRGNER